MHRLYLELGTFICSLTCYTKNIAIKMMNALLQQLQQRNFQDLKGTALTIELPIPLDLLNEVIKVAIKGIDVLQEVKITDMYNGEVTIEVRTTIFTFKERTITGRIVKALNVVKPAIQIEITDGLGFAGRKLVGMALPDGMELENKVLCISLHHFLFTTPQSQALLQFLKKGEIETRAHDFLLRIQLER